MFYRFIFLLVGCFEEIMSWAFACPMSLVSPLASLFGKKGKHEKLRKDWKKLKKEKEEKKQVKLWLKWLAWQSFNKYLSMRGVQENRKKPNLKKNRTKNSINFYFLCPKFSMLEYWTNKWGGLLSLSTFQFKILFFLHETMRVKILKFW